MPWYDFLCEECSEEFEENLSLSDDRSNVKCPKCGSKKVERVFNNISMGCGSDGCSSESETPTKKRSGG